MMAAGGVGAARRAAASSLAAPGSSSHSHSHSPWAAWGALEGRHIGLSTSSGTGSAARPSRCFASTSRCRGEHPQQLDLDLDHARHAQHAGEAAATAAAPPPVKMSSRFVHINNLPLNARAADIYRLYDASSQHRLGELNTLTFLRTPLLNFAGQAIADFNSEAAAKRFQRAVDGISISGKHLRVSTVPQRTALDLLRSHASPNLPAQLVHFLVSQTTGTSVILRGLPASLYVRCLYEDLASAYALAPETQIRLSRRTSHLASLFDACAPIFHQVKAERAHRHDELLRLQNQVRRQGLMEVINALRQQEQHQLEEGDDRFGAGAGSHTGDYYDANRLLSKAKLHSGWIDNDLFGGEEEGGNGADRAPSADAAQLIAPQGRTLGIEGPDLRLETISEDDGDPYSYLNPAKIFWDIIWSAAHHGQPYPSKSTATSSSTSNSAGPRRRGPPDGMGDPDSDASSHASSYIPYLPVIKLPFPAMQGAHHYRAWFVVRLTDAADAHRLVRRWHNMYYRERDFGQRYLVDAQVLY